MKLTKQYIDMALKQDPLRKCAFTFFGSLSITTLKSSRASSYFSNFITKYKKYSSNVLNSNENNI